MRTFDALQNLIPNLDTLATWKWHQIPLTFQNFVQRHVAVLEHDAVEPTMRPAVHNLREQATCVVSALSGDTWRRLTETSDCTQQLSCRTLSPRDGRHDAAQPPYAGA